MKKRNVFFFLIHWMYCTHGNLTGWKLDRVVTLQLEGDFFFFFWKGTHYSIETGNLTVYRRVRAETGGVREHKREDAQYRR